MTGLVDTGTKKILVTGSAGFIGYHLVNRLLRDAYEITGLDNINDYYDVNLKYARLESAGIERAAATDVAADAATNAAAVQSKTNRRYRFIRAELADRRAMQELFESERFDLVIHLAAQAGVRYSLENPHSYIDSNISGFLNILEGCRHTGVGHLIYASSSSVYGANTSMPFKTSDNVDHPVSLYAASKKSNELMAHTYSSLFGIPTTGLRFFTVYGPWGRPDMALFLFTKAILEGKPIDVFNHGKMERDFTYVDDIIESIARLVPKVPAGNETWDGNNPDPSSSFCPYRIFNIGNSNPVKLMDFIHGIESKLGLTAEKNLMPMQPGDVRATWADVSDLFDVVNFKPQVGIEEGIGKFVDWYRGYYGV